MTITHEGMKNPIAGISGAVELSTAQNHNSILSFFMRKKRKETDHIPAHRDNIAANDIERQKERNQYLKSVCVSYMEQCGL